MHLIV